MQFKIKLNFSGEHNNQGLFNSCNACSIISAIEFAIYRDLGVKQKLSIMFSYYVMRKQDNKLLENVPLNVDNSVKAVVDNGFIENHYWPYPTSCFSHLVVEQIANKKTETLLSTIETECIRKQSLLSETLALTPSPDLIEKAKQAPEINAEKLSIDDGLDILFESLIQGIPFIFGLEIPLSFMATPKSGYVELPSPFEKRLGGHSFLCLGFDHEKEVFICRNSMGTEFGDNGDCYIPYSYITGSHFDDNRELTANTFSFWRFSVNV